MKHSILISLAGCLFLLGASGSYHLIKKVPLSAAPGGGEYFDYINFDAASRRAYLSHGTEVKVLDGDNYSEVGNITGLKRDHGVAIVHELNRGFITDGDAAEVAVFDLKTLQITQRIKTDKDSDSILYDPASKHIFCFEGDPNTVSVIDPVAAKVITTLPLGGAPEQAVSDGQGTIYDNLEDKNEVIAIDSRTLKIKSRWPVASGGQPVAIALDRRHRRLFIGCRNPHVFVVMDADTGKIVSPAFPIGTRVDSNVFDPETGLVACATGEGTIHLFREDSPDKFSLVETVKTEFGAKTMGLDPKTHNLLVDTADFENQSAPRPKTKPGTFRLLVYGR